ncbi:MAG: hypothetical protein EXR52_06870 [Dehalococcoidia bacterium]|nr:hypothetical protein [Dehalococcoidia bacterium]
MTGPAVQPERWELEDRVQRLQATIREHQGSNVSHLVETEVDELLSAFYDDITELRFIGLKTLFHLFLIKTLYVNRSSTDPDVMDYLAECMSGFLYTRDLFPLMQDQKRFGWMLSDMLQEMQNLTKFPNLFEGYRKMGDYSLFIAGVFSASLRRRRVNRWRGGASPVHGVDLSHHVSTGKLYYLQASQHSMAEATGQRNVLRKLSTHFEIYRDALGEASERYILGFDMNLIADKMLDSFNRFRRTGDARHLENARKYAAILHVDRAGFPSLWRLRRRPRAALL